MITRQRLVNNLVDHAKCKLVYSHQNAAAALSARLLRLFKQHMRDKAFKLSLRVEYWPAQLQLLRVCGVNGGVSGVRARKKLHKERQQRVCSRFLIRVIYLCRQKCNKRVVRGDVHHALAQSMLLIRVRGYNYQAQVVRCLKS